MSHYELSCDGHHEVEDIYKRWEEMIPEEEDAQIEAFAIDLLKRNPQSSKEFARLYTELRRIHKVGPRKAQLQHMLTRLEARAEADETKTVENLDKAGDLRRFLIKKEQKSQSGVLVVTVLTSPYPTVGDKVQQFSCKWDCHYCPKEPGQPRSYLHDEPSVIRANRNQFDPVLQFMDRAGTLANNGHPVDKLELLVLGGTWSSYPHQYQEDFIKGLIYAANIFHLGKHERREPLSLSEEVLLNENAICKIIGITLETRPDCITKEELIRFRQMACTRVQIGIQHTDDAILKLLNRGCTTQDATDAIKLLLDNCFKVDGHFMPDLPGSSKELDWLMFQRVLYSPDLCVDQMKLYPHAVVPWTTTKKWMEEGKYTPCSQAELVDLLVKFKSVVHPWIRLNRVIRDIPSHYVANEGYMPNLRQVIEKKMTAIGVRCKCIRCREVGGSDSDLPLPVLVRREYAASGGREIFISFETPDYNTIFGFLRLRLSPDAGRGKNGTTVFPELLDCALVRELHVYGQLIPTTDKTEKRAQHQGYGTRLLEEAERLAVQGGFRRIAVISGIGVRNYYRKFGYELHPGDGGFLCKELCKSEIPQSLALIVKFPALPPTMSQSTGSYAAEPSPPLTRFALAGVLLLLLALLITRIQG